MLKYIREVPLELSSLWAARACRSQELDDLLTDRALRTPPVVHSPFADSAAQPLPAGQVDTLAQAFSEALDEARLAEDTANAPLSTCRFVHSDSGKWHRLAPAGLTGASCSWTSACGWRFGGTLASLSVELPSNLCHKLLCGRCFPELRARLKEEA